MLGALAGLHLMGKQRLRISNGAQSRSEEQTELRRRLVRRLNLLAAARETPRGLVLQLPDVWFAAEKPALKSAAREKLARIAGIVLAYPGLKVAIEGHGPARIHNSLRHQIEQRAYAVREYLRQQEVPATVTISTGRSESPAPRPHTAAAAHSSLELVLSGEPIGLPAPDSKAR